MTGATPSSLRIAVDIGGTFTDLVLEQDGRVANTKKVLTTPVDPSEAAATGVRQLLEDRQSSLVAEVLHGTTLVPNALIERKGARTGLITTEGFRDVLEMGREQRYDLYDLFLELPEPLVPRRRWRWEATERIRADGTVDTALDEHGVQELCRQVANEGVESVAVCFLHAYMEPNHERRTREILLEELPELSVTISSEVSPELGEYHRVSTTVANAFVLPVIDRYLATLEKRLVEIGIGAPVRIMLSNGGLASMETARRFPIRLLESGPAAGVLSAGYAAGGSDRVLAFDMGGTTAKAALVEQGIPVLAREHEAARMSRFVRGSGLPVKVPVIDMIEIGAGGGSIARKGIFGLPKVGPDSASSYPGPAAYGLGGTEATVTDADLVLGYLDPENFLGGAMRLHVSSAWSALSRLGDDLGLDAADTAAAIHRVVNENMASAARMHAIERGRDIRRYVLVATGGAGPVHAWGVARALGLIKLIFPPRAGVASAFGMLTAPTAFEFARSMPSPLRTVRWDNVRSTLRSMLDEGQDQLAASNVEVDQVTVSVDVRFEGQGAAITVNLGAELPYDPARAVEDRFHDDYERLYGSRPSDVGLEVITWRMRVASPPASPDVAPPFDAEANPEPTSRPMWFSDTQGFIRGKVFTRAALPIGFTFEGPAVVEEPESTIVIGPRGSAIVAASGNVEVTIDA
jgi:N-methylhydantoinase A